MTQLRSAKDAPDLATEAARRACEVDEVSGACGSGFSAGNPSDRLSSDETGGSDEKVTVLFGQNCSNCSSRRGFGEAVEVAILSDGAAVEWLLVVS